MALIILSKMKQLVQIRIDLESTLPLPHNLS